MRPEGAIANREHVRFAKAMTVGIEIGVLQAFVEERRAACSLPLALGQGLDDGDYHSSRHLKAYRPTFNRVQPTWSLDSAAALRSASPRNTVLFSPAMRAVVPGLP
jgi:hypothetical protein